MIGEPVTDKLYAQHRAMNGTRTGSWHIVANIIQYRGGPGFLSLCGIKKLGPTEKEFPWDEKTCEKCFRIDEHGRI